MTRVLIVDDREDHRYLLRALLEGHGFAVEEARHGAEALVKARLSPPAVVVSDLLMPVMDGYSLLREWRTDDGLKAVPFVVYTATYTEPKDERLALSLGADAFVIKPAEPDVLVARIRAVLAAARAGRPAAGPAAGKDGEFLRDHNEVLVRKLEKKARELERANRELTAEIAERNQAEAELARTSHMLRAVADGVSDAIFVKDRAGRYLLCNAACARFAGRSVAEVLGRTDADLFDPASARAVAARDRAVMDAGAAETQEETLTAAGVTRTYLVTKAPFRDGDGAVVGVLGISRDITDRKRVEDALRDSEAKLTEAVRLARMGYWNRDLRTGRLDWSDTLYDIFGADPAGFDHTLGAFLARVHPDDRERVRGRVAAAEGLPGTFEQTYRIVGRGGERVVHEIVSVVTGADGRPVRVTGTARDVTDVVRSEEALRVRDRAIQAVSQGIVITDPTLPDNPVVFANNGFERITGYRPDEAAGRNCRFLQGKDTDREAVAQVREAVAAGRGCSVEVLNYRKDGTPFWNQLTVSPVLSPAGRPSHFVGVLTDVTERRRLEEQFRQSQKMEAIGQLAGGVAHDFNNLLTIINGYSDLLLQSTAAADPSRALIVEIQKAGERSAGLTRQLLAFSRKQVLAPRVLDLNAVIADTQRLLHRVLGEDVRLTAVLSPGLGRVRADPGQLEQVLMNLAVNARDAMPTGGQLTIETRNVELDGAFAHAHLKTRPGGYVLLTVSDTGCGMTDEVKAHIFEPFFTTKEPGKGTGLGLATVFGIVQQSQGAVDVYSEVGVGTTFKVYLPRAGDALAAAPQAAPRSPPRGTETILLAEDEDGVRALSRHVLAGCGYTVLEATDGNQAMRIARDRAGAIDLLVTDVVMPGSGGRVLAEQIRERYPAVKVLFVSGYADDAVVRHGVLSEQVEFLQKPFSPFALGVKVREVLDR